MRCELTRLPGRRIRESLDALQQPGARLAMGADARLRRDPNECGANRPDRGPLSDVSWVRLIDSLDHVIRNIA